jgi:FkbM family methyltransferase
MKKIFSYISYEIVDKFLMNDFFDEIMNIIKKKAEYTIFDIGCYKGKFSLGINKKLQNGKYYLFDANSNLKEDLYKSLPFFKFYQTGIYSKVSTKSYYYNTGFPSSGSSIDCLTKDDWFWNLSRRFVTLNFFSTYKKYKIKTITLDKFSKDNKIGFVDILKIDVEGSELEVLKGAQNILKNTSIILLEIIDTNKMFLTKYKKIISLLKQYDFKIVKEKKISSVSIFSKLKSIDVLFSKI